MKTGARAQRFAIAGVCLITGIFFAFALEFARQPTLASFADDSVSYIVMAQALSPWTEASPAVLEAWPRETTYPPLFPLVLALAGLAGSIGAAQVLMVVLVAAWLPLVFLLGRRLLGDSLLALGAVAVVAVLPELWIGAKGVLSEPLFGLLLLATVLALQRKDDGAPHRLLLSCLMVSLVLTRSVALVMAGAYVAWAYSPLAPRGGVLKRLQRASPALVALLAYAGWVLVRPLQEADSYLQIAATTLGGWEGGAGNFLAALARRVLVQSGAIGESWSTALMLYWTGAWSPRYLTAMLAGALALAGLGIRFARGEADAWLMAAYLGTFLVWPFPGQMTRFLFPVLPVLVLYCLSATVRLVRIPAHPRTGPAVLVLLLLGLGAPTQAFLQERKRVGLESGYARIREWYRVPDFARARDRAEIQLGLFEDMDAIRRSTGPDARVAWVMPAYVALLADRHAVPAPVESLPAAGFRRAIRQSGATHLFLSVEHPRSTGNDAAWRAGLGAMQCCATLVYGRRNADGNLESMLLQVDAGRLAAEP